MVSFLFDPSKFSSDNTFMKKILVSLLFLLTSIGVFAAEKTEAKYKLRTPEGTPAEFKESWGYVTMKRSEEYSKTIPLTDVCFFSAEINCYGELVSIPDRKKIDIGNARSHMVIVCDSYSLSHMVLNPDFGIRKKLIKDIVKAADPFDGVQIDFEVVPARDRLNFHSFIEELRNALPGEKWFTMCVPARVKLLQDDMYPYEKLSKLVDRIFVMCYDQHWSGSTPGAIAEVEWSKKVAKYAQSVIPEKKLIMGIPFYGRTWVNKTTAQAWYFSGANRIMRENGVSEVTYENDIPSFKYKTQVEVTGFFNDAYSDHKLCKAYEEMGIKKIGFWRIGQEDPDFWKWIKITK